MRRTAIYFICLVFLLQAQAQDFTAVAKHDKKGLHVKVYPSSLKAYEVYRKQGIDVSIGLTDGSEIIKKLAPAPGAQWKGNPSAEAGLHLLQEEVESGRAETFNGLIARDKQLRYSHGLYLMVTSMDEKASELSGMSWTLDTPPAELNITIHSEAYSELDTAITITARQIARRASSPNIETVGLQSAVEVVWGHGTYFREIVGYNLERKKGNGKWRKINESPIVYSSTGADDDQEGDMRISYTDSTDADYIAYEYRLIAIDFFGKQRLPSAVSPCMSRDLTPPEIALPIGLEFMEGEAVISWKQNQLNDIDRVIIIKSVDGPNASFDVCHEGSLQAGLGVFKEQIEDPELAIYYKLLMADTAGNIAVSEPLFLDIPDIYPPAPPSGLKAYVDSLGQVDLMWHHSTSPDITGYKVFRSDHLQREFIQVSKGKVSANLLVDQISLRKHDPSVFYFIRSVDDNYNNSIPSDTIRVLRPDTVAPSAPVLTTAEASGKSIHVTWLPSSSEDVSSYIVMVADEGNWKEAHRAPQNASEAEFIYEMAEANQFTLVAEDELGNRSERGRVLTLMPEESLNSNVKAIELDGQVQITWEEVQGEVLLYRAEGEGGFRMIKAFASDERSFLDRDVKKGVVYRYATAVRKENGLKTAMGAHQIVEL